MTGCVCFLEHILLCRSQPAASHALAIELRRSVTHGQGATTSPHTIAYGIHELRACFMSKKKKLISVAGYQSTFVNLTSVFAILFIFFWGGFFQGEAGEGEELTSEEADDLKRM